MRIDMTAIWESNRIIMDRDLLEKKKLEKEVNRILVGLTSEKSVRKTKKKRIEKSAA